MRGNLAIVGAIEPFEWPTEAELDGEFEQLADTSEFARWLWDIGERQISMQTLQVLYAEYCCIVRRAPLKLTTLQRRLRNAGIVAEKGKTERTTYRVLPRKK